MSPRKRLLDERLEHLESIRENHSMPDNWVDVLEALARCESGVLSYEEQLEEYLRPI